VRLLTYNIHKGVGGRDRRYRLERIIEVIDREQADLICLQEVTHGARRSRYHDQARLLADHFQFPGTAFQMNVHWKVGGYGNLLLSRWPFRHRHHVSLRRRQKKPRGAQIVVVDTPFGPLHLVNWHLGLAERERHWQVGHLLTHRLFADGDGLPTIIAGDSNDWRNRLAAGGLAGLALRQVSSPPSRFRTFPAWMPLGSLDKVFCCEQVQVSSAHVVRTQAARRASDHLPVVVDFDIGPDVASADERDV
jgi:endonuclease/exonuclease/phosphatase family metal-dependent hydrolase